MPIQTTWHFENRVLLYDFFGQIDFADIQQLNDDYLFHSEQTGNVLHSIADLRKMENLNLSMKDLVQMRNVKTFGGWTLIIRRPEAAYSKVIQIFMKLSEKIFGMRLAVVESTEAAEKFLLEKDSTLKGEFQ